MELIKRRRSIRAYRPEPVSEETITLLLEAAMSAPSAHNARPWHFVVVKGETLKQEFSQVHTWSRMAEDAPVVFVVLGDTKASPHFWAQDCSAATQNLLLAVAGLGLGAVWVGLAGGAQKQVEKLVGAPAHLKALCLVPVGHPAEEKSPRTQYDDSRVHREHFGGR